MVAPIVRGAKSTTPLLPYAPLTNRGITQMEKLRQAHAKEKKEALAEFRSFKRGAKAREESIQARPAHVFPANEQHCCVVLLQHHWLRLRPWGARPPECRKVPPSSPPQKTS